MFTLLFPAGLLILAIFFPLFLLLILSWRNEQEILRAFLLKSKPWIFVAEFFILSVFVVFIAIVAARPVLFVNETTRIKLAEDTEVLLVFDVSRSMLAEKKTYTLTRIERAKIIGNYLVRRMEARIGVAGFTDIMMAHLLPTTDFRAIDFVVKENVQVESIPFSIYDGGRLDDIVNSYISFFSQHTKNKIIVVFTDGDMSALTQDTQTEILSKDNVTIFFVGIGVPGEVIYIYDEEGKLIGIDPYVVNFNKNVLLDSARIVGGRYFDESDSTELLEAIKKVADKDGSIEEITQRSRAIEFTALTAIAALAALIFFLCLRRPN